MSQHNKGPREAEYYLSALADFRAAVADWSGAAIDGESACSIRNLIGEIDALAKHAEKDRKALKEPYLEQGRKIDASFKPVAALAGELLAPLKSALSAFLAAEEKRKREAAEAARREAAAAEAAAQKLKDDAFVGDYAAEQAEEKAKEARYAEILAQQNSIKGDADRALGLRTYRKARVTNAAMLVGHFAAHPDVIALCERLANAQIRAAKRGDVAIPGIEIVEDKRVA